MDVWRLLFVGQTGVEYVIIPVKHGFSRILQKPEETGFYFIQHIEADEYVAVITQPVCVKLFYDMAVHHTFISDTQFGEILPVIPVNIS